MQQVIRDWVHEWGWRLQVWQLEVGDSSLRIVAVVVHRRFRRLAYWAVIIDGKTMESGCSWLTVFARLASDEAAFRWLEEINERAESPPRRLGKSNA